MGAMSVFAAAACAVVMIQGAVHAQTGPTEVPLMCVSENPAFCLVDLRGRFAAIHFMPGLDAPEHEAHVREYLNSAAAEAGVVHIFVHAGDAGAMKSWWTKWQLPGAMAAHDAAGRLALEFNLELSASSGPCATVVLDREGNELFRHLGSDASDYLPFAAFAARLDELSRPRAVDEYNLPKGKTLAVKGYDTVSYFTDGKAMKGKPEIASRYLGVTYHFATPQHRTLFAAAPEKYTPTYGGWCASAMGDGGRKVPIDPTNFKVKDGRLFLFYKGLGSDARKDWDRHEAEWEPAADEHWSRISGEPAVK